MNRRRAGVLRSRRSSEKAELMAKVYRTAEPESDYNLRKAYLWREQAAVDSSFSKWHLKRLRRVQALRGLLAKGPAKERAKARKRAKKERAKAMKRAKKSQKT